MDLSKIDAILNKFTPTKAVNHSITHLSGSGGVADFYGLHSLQNLRIETDGSISDTTSTPQTISKHAFLNNKGKSYSRLHFDKKKFKDSIKDKLRRRTNLLKSADALSNGSSGSATTDYSVSGDISIAEFSKSVTPSNTKYAESAALNANSNSSNVSKSGSDSIPSLAVNTSKYDNISRSTLSTNGSTVINSDLESATLIDLNRILTDKHSPIALNESESISQSDNIDSNCILGSEASSHDNGLELNSSELLNNRLDISNTSSNGSFRHVNNKQEMQCMNEKFCRMFSRNSEASSTCFASVGASGTTIGKIVAAKLSSAFLPLSFGSYNPIRAGISLGCDSEIDLKQIIQSAASDAEYMPVFVDKHNKPFIVCSLGKPTAACFSMGVLNIKSSKKSFLSCHISPRCSKLISNISTDESTVDIVHDPSQNLRIADLQHVQAGGVSMCRDCKIILQKRNKEFNCNNVSAYFRSLNNNLVFPIHKKRGRKKLIQT